MSTATEAEIGGNRKMLMSLAEWALARSRHVCPFSPASLAVSRLHAHEPVFCRSSAIHEQEHLIPPTSKAAYCLLANGRIMRNKLDLHQAVRQCPDCRFLP